MTKAGDYRKEDTVSGRIIDMPIQEADSSLGINNLTEWLRADVTSEVHIHANGFDRWKKFLRHIATETLKNNIHRIKLYTCSHVGADLTLSEPYARSAIEITEELARRAIADGLAASRHIDLSTVWTSQEVMTSLMASLTDSLRSGVTVYVEDVDEGQALDYVFRKASPDILELCLTHLVVIDNPVYDDGVLTNYNVKSFVEEIKKYIDMNVHGARTVGELTLSGTSLIGNDIITLSEHSRVETTVQYPLKFVPFKGATIDIETVGTATDSAVIEIGVVIFDDEKIIDEQNFQLPLTPQLKKGLAFDSSTVAWWFDDNLESLGKITGERSSVPDLKSTTVEDVLINLDIFITTTFEKHGFHADEKRIFTCGTDFDIPIIRNLYKAFNITPEFIKRFRVVRDWRTIAEHFLLMTNDFKRPYNKHSALEDARNETLLLLQMNAVMAQLLRPIRFR